MSSTAETHRYVSASIVPRQPRRGVFLVSTWPAEKNICVDTRKKKLEMWEDLLTLQGSRMNMNERMNEHMNKHMNEH